MEGTGWGFPVRPWPRGGNPLTCAGQSGGRAGAWLQKPDPEVSQVPSGSDLEPQFPCLSSYLVAHSGGLNETMLAGPAPWGAHLVPGRAGLWECVHRAAWEVCSLHWWAPPPPAPTLPFPPTHTGQPHTQA